MNVNNDLIAKALSDARVEKKKNFSFSLRPSTTAAFKNLCKEANVNPSNVLESIMLQMIKGKNDE